MSAQLEMPTLPVADPAWLERVMAERIAEAQQAKREQLRRAVVDLCFDADNFGFVTTAQVLEHVEDLDADFFEAPKAAWVMAMRLHDLAKRGMLQHLRADTSYGRRRDAMWGAP